AIWAANRMVQGCGACWCPPGKVRLRGAHEVPGTEPALTYTQACFPEASVAATRLYAAGCSYRSAAASSASVISNTVPLTRLSFLPLNVTLTWCVMPLEATSCGSSILTNDGSNPGSSSFCPWSSL